MYELNVRHSGNTQSITVNVQWKYDKPSEFLRFKTVLCIIWIFETRSVTMDPRTKALFLARDIILQKLGICIYMFKLWLVLVFLPAVRGI